MRIARVVAGLVAVVGLLGTPVLRGDDSPNGAPSISDATHKQVRTIRPLIDGKPVQMKTFALGPDGNLWACVTAGNSADGYLAIVDVEGKTLRTIAYDFVPQAINFAPDGTPFVAGSGKVARLDSQGEIVRAVDAPNLLSEEEMKEKLRARVEGQIERMMEGMKSQIERIEEQIAKLESEADGEEDDAASERLRKRNELRLGLLRRQAETLQRSADSTRERYESMYSSVGSFAQVKRATGLSISDRDVFVSVPSWEGFGYAIYRMTHDLEDGKIVTDSVGGCCGQLDIQSDGKNLLIAMNTSFKVGTYDRDGNSLASFGERSSDGKSAGWGSCCNPMNIRCLDNGEILVAESSIGHIKRYDTEGRYLGLVGTARIAGGCKHVALAVHPEKNWYFMMNQTAHNIAVLVPNEEAPDETEEEREGRLAMQGLGPKLIGTWIAETPPAQENEKPEPSEPAAVSDDADFEDGNIDIEVEDSFDFGSYIAEQHKYLVLAADRSASKTPPQQSASRSGVLGAMVSLLVPGASVATQSSSMRWVPLRQQQDVVYFALEENQTRDYVAGVRFLDDDRAEFQWFYGDPDGEPLATVTYRRGE